VKTIKSGCLILIAAIVFAAMMSHFSSKPPAPQTAVPVTDRTAPPVTAAPTIGAAELRKLTEERQYAVDMLTTVQGILNASSFAARAELYCHFTVRQTELLTGGNFSGDRLEARYQELMNEEPTTQDGEIRRQQQLRSLEYFVTTHRQNLADCRAMLSNGMLRMFSDPELREKAIEAQQKIADIDRQLTSGVVAPESDASPETSPSTNQTLPPADSPSEPDRQ
jgi:hypothetical protein